MTGKDGAPGHEWDSTMKWSGLESSTGARSPEGEDQRERRGGKPNGADLRAAPAPPPEGDGGGTDDGAGPKGTTPPSGAANLPPNPRRRKRELPPRREGNAPSMPPPAARRDPSPPAVPKTTEDGTRAADANEATWAQVVSKAVKRATAQAAKNETAPPRPPKSAKAPAPTKKTESGGKTGGGAKKGSTAVSPQASGKKAPPLKLRSPNGAAITLACADPSAYQKVTRVAAATIAEAPSAADVADVEMAVVAETSTAAADNVGEGEERGTK
ncbi:hypothetical protein G5I_10715 [Acromyrmex echinatior]|uniref:Uncharacterized protein n=1 Tax=Acromyrmex echinatior TaxID=103372 RepID=F4WXM9_ACREC|nr:hypothetical protein G5I_10715 [Acromyrmex echinatior]